jgi:Tfp pilus assembly protein PilE
MSEAPDYLTRAALEARRAAAHAALLEAMRTVEQYRGALALLDELLALPDPPPPRGLEAVA